MSTALIFVNQHIGWQFKFSPVPQRWFVSAKQGRQNNSGVNEASIHMKRETRAFQVRDLVNDKSEFNYAVPWKYRIWFFPLFQFPICSKHGRCNFGLLPWSAHDLMTLSMPVPPHIATKMQQRVKYHPFRKGGKMNRAILVTLTQASRTSVRLGNWMWSMDSL